MCQTMLLDSGLYLLHCYTLFMVIGRISATAPTVSLELLGLRWCTLAENMATETSQNRDIKANKSQFFILLSKANTAKINYIPYAYEEQPDSQIQLIISTGCSYSLLIFVLLDSTGQEVCIMEELESYFWFALSHCIIYLATFASDAAIMVSGGFVPTHYTQLILV